MLKALLIGYTPLFYRAISYYDVTRLAILAIAELIALPYRPVGMGLLPLQCDDVDLGRRIPRLRSIRRYDLVATGN